MPGTVTNSLLCLLSHRAERVQGAAADEADAHRHPAVPHLGHVRTLDLVEFGRRAPVRHERRRGALQHPGAEVAHAQHQRPVGRPSARLSDLLLAADYVFDGGFQLRDFPRARLAAELFFYHCFIFLSDVEARCEASELFFTVICASEVATGWREKHFCAPPFQQDFSFSVLRSVLVKSNLRNLISASYFESLARPFVTPSCVITNCEQRHLLSQTACGETGSEMKFFS